MSYTASVQRQRFIRDKADLVEVCAVLSAILVLHFLSTPMARNGSVALTIYFRALTEEQLYLESPNLARVMNFRDPGVRLISVPKGQRSRSQS